MKQLIILILTLSMSQPAHASNCVTTEFSTTHVDLLNCAKHGVWNYRDLLYYKGITSLLDRYITETKLYEKLSPKKLQLVLHPRFWAVSVFAIDQSKDYYSLQFRGVMNPALFLGALHYLAADNWQPFPGTRLADSKYSDEAVLEELKELLRAKIGEIDLSLVKDQRFIVMNLGQLRIIYENGALFYELAGARLKEAVRDPIPVRTGDRYLLGSAQGISVYESGDLIAEIDLPRGTLPRPIFPVVSHDGVFVDFYSGNGITRDGTFLIYSAKTNSFHEIRPSEPRGWPPGRSSAECEQANLYLCAANALTQIGFFVLSHDAG